MYRLALQIAGNDRALGQSAGDSAPLRRGLRRSVLASGMPQSEAAFCAPAAALAEAIVAGDTPAIVGLSRPDVFRCQELDASIFTGCQSADVLEGHPIGTAGGSIEVHPESAYSEELDATKAAIDASYSDDAGTGEARVLGTSACGPDDPARRSYYVAWTAAVRAGSGDAERVVAQGCTNSPSATIDGSSESSISTPSPAGAHATTSQFATSPAASLAWGAG